MSTRDERIEIAMVYLRDGLVRKDGDAVRQVLAPGCWRIEQGRNTGSSAEEIAKAFELPIFQIISGLGPLRWVAEDEQLVAFYELELQGGELAPVRIAERFLVRDGKIHEIEAIFHQPGAADPA